MKLELTDKLHLRFDASRTLTRPGLNLMTPVASVDTGQRVGALTASGGSPALKPYLSDNFDNEAEGCYKPNYYGANAFFLTKVYNLHIGRTSDGEKVGRKG